MKKIISIILIPALILATCFCVHAAPVEGTKTEAFINGLLSSKSLSFAIKDGIVEDSAVDITDLNIMFKVQEESYGLADMKIAATAKADWVKLHAIFGEEDRIYFKNLFSYISIDEFLETQDDPEVNFSVFATAVNYIFKYLDADFLDSLVLTYAGNRYIEAYGDVYVERFGTLAEFYYDGDTLLGFKALVHSSDYLYITINTADFLPEFVEGISTDVDESMFEFPSGLYLNITPLAKFIYSIIKEFNNN